MGLALYFGAKLRRSVTELERRISHVALRT